MKHFSSKISDFFAQVGIYDDLQVAEVPKSTSCAVPGDFLFFKYSPKYKRDTGGKGSNWRVILLVEPVVKQAGTGNLLLTGFELPDSGTYTPDSLSTLYKNKELPEDSYKTFILNTPYTVSPLYRIRQT
jgi:hypothetical protein